MNDINKVIEIIENSQNILLTSHISPDGDSITSMLALYYILTSLGKNCKMIIDDEVPYLYDFLENYKYIKRYSPSMPKKYKFDLAIVIDCGDYSRVEGVRNLIKNKTFVLNIDHHLANPRFGDYNYIDWRSSSTSEIIFYMAKKMNFNITPPLAEMIFVGMLTDTGSFRYSNTTANTFKVAAELMKLGANNAYLSTMIYERNRLEKFKLLEVIFRRMRFYFDNKLVVSYLSHKDMDNVAARKGDMEGLIDFLRSIDTVRVAAILLELDNGITKVSLRSKGEINVMLIAKQFGGGGHKNAAGCKINARYKTACKRLLTALEEVL